MLVLLVGLLVVSVPVALAVVTVLRVTRVLGAVDASAIADVVDRADLPALAGALAREAPGSIAERLITIAAREDPPPQRKIALAEEVAEIERALEGDLRVPRVAASLSTTGGLFAAALVMRQGLGVVLPEGADPLPHFYGVIDRGLTLAAVAVLGGIVCASLHRRSQQERRARIGELDALLSPLGRRLFGSDDL